MRGIASTIRSLSNQSENVKNTIHWFDYFRVAVNLIMKARINAKVLLAYE